MFSFGKAETFLFYFFILFTSVISVEMMQQNQFSYSFDFCGLIFGHDSLASSYSKGVPDGLSVKHRTI